MNPFESEAFGLFHMLWSRAPGGPGYDKQDWKTLERLVTRQDCYTSEGVQAFDRLVKAARQSTFYDAASWWQLAALLKLEKHLEGDPGTGGLSASPDTLGRGESEDMN